MYTVIEKARFNAFLPVRPCERTCRDLLELFNERADTTFAHYWWVAIPESGDRNKVILQFFWRNDEFYVDDKVERARRELMEVLGENWRGTAWLLEAEGRYDPRGVLQFWDYLKL